MKKINTEGRIAILMGIFGALIAIFVKEIHDFFMENYKIFVFVLLVMAAIIFAIISIFKNRYNVLKNKIIALKEFRDAESLRMGDHFSIQNKEFEDRLFIINKRVEAYPEEEEEEIKDDKTAKAEDDAEKAWQKTLKQYNKHFEDWGIGDYGIGGNTTFYKKKGYKR